MNRNTPLVGIFNFFGARYKIIKTDDLIYASLDPYWEEDNICDQDNDYILFKNIEVQVVNE